MRLTSKYLAGLSVLVLAFVSVSYGQALNSSVANVNLNATLAESLTVAASPATVNFTLAPNGPAAGSAPVSITTNWALASTRTSVSLFAYFSSTAALTDAGGTTIPNTAVSGNPNGAGLQPFTTANPFNGANTGLQIFNVAITGANVNTSRTDSLALQIDTTGLGLPAGTYTGILNIEAQAL